MDLDEIEDIFNDANFVSLDEESGSDEDACETNDSDEDSWESYEEAIVPTEEEIRKEEEKAEIENYLTLHDIGDDKNDDESGEKMVSKFQLRWENEIISVLCSSGAVESDDIRGGGDILYNVTRKLMRMMAQDYYLHPSDLCQGYIIQRLQSARLLATHCLRDNEIHKEDFIMLPSQKKTLSCNVSDNCHGDEIFSCSCTCSLPSSSGVVWRWPKNNDCGGIFPEGTGHTIIRRLAYKAGIIHMTPDAFDLAEVELIHTMATLLIEAYEESVRISRVAQFLPQEQLSPGLLHHRTKNPLYCIELEHIETAARRRNIILSSDGHIRGDALYFNQMRAINGMQHDEHQYRIFMTNANKAKRQHLQKKFEAATKIIAQWRGYHYRMLNKQNQISTEMLEPSPNEEIGEPSIEESTNSPTKKKIRTNEIGRIHELEVELEKKECIHNEVLKRVQCLHDENQVLREDLAVSMSQIKKLEEELQISKCDQSEIDQYHQKEMLLKAQFLCLRHSKEQCNVLREELAAAVTENETLREELNLMKQAESDMERHFQKVQCELALSTSEKKQLYEELQQIKRKQSDATEQCSTLTREKKALEREMKSLQRQRAVKEQSGKSLEDDECSKTDEEKIRESLQPIFNKPTESVLWEDIKGNKHIKDELCILPISGNLPAYLLKNQHPKQKNLGILLHGPPGTGKTMFAKALATHTRGNFIDLSPTDIVDQHFGNTEKRMKAVLDMASEKSEESDRPAILFLDEVDALLGKPTRNDCEARTNAIKIFQMWMQGFEDKKSPVIVVAATNFVKRLPKAVLSRFSKSILVDRPSKDDIIDIIKQNLKARKAQSEISESEYQYLAQRIHHESASGRDVESLCDNTMDVILIEDKEAEFWCQNKLLGKYVPCNHSEETNCGRKRPSKVSNSMRSLPPWSLRHFETALDKFGVTRTGV
eukprot:scaffold62487_cov47-Cyclotella_meneghiniana.AAC.4